MKKLRILIILLFGVLIKGYNGIIKYCVWLSLLYKYVYFFGGLLGGMSEVMYLGCFI